MNVASMVCFPQAETLQLNAYECAFERAEKFSKTAGEKDNITQAGDV